MKHEKTKTCLTGFFLAWMVSWGVAGSLVTGLELEVVHMDGLFWFCGGLAAACALCFRFRWGGLVLAGILAGTGWLLWRDGRILQQTLYLLKRLATLCSNAYGIGVPGFLRKTGEPGSLGLAVAMVAALPAVGISRTVCRRGSTAVALLAGILPMGLCFLVTDTVPDEIYLYLWMLGLTLLLLTNGVRNADAGQGITLVTLAAVPVAVALGLLFWLVPREGYDQQPEQLQERIVNWAQDIPRLWEDTAGEISSAISTEVQPGEVNLKNLGPRIRRTYPVMEVTAPESGTLYLRGQDYDLYDGTGWTATGRRSDRFFVTGMTSAGNVTVSTRRVRDVMYLPYYPDNGITLVGGKLTNSRNLKDYSFSQWRLPRDWRQQIRDAEERDPDSGNIVLTLSAEPAPGDRRYLTLPIDTQKWAVELLKTVLTDERSATAAADTIAAYVKNSARYDLNTSRMTGNSDFAQWFLEKSETGYCVHFATAATVLLRAAGIEARYVEGYMTTVRADAEVTVTEDQAHAWAEYYEPILDTWIVLEATPADLAEQDAPTAPWEVQTNPPEETHDTHPSETTPETQSDTGRDEDAAGTDGKNQPNSAGIPGWVGWIFLTAALMAAIWGQRKLRLAYRHRLRESGSTNARALQRWREIEALCRLLKTACPAEMEQLAQKAKYSPHIISPEELHSMDDTICSFREKLLAKPWYKKILYQYFFAVI